MTTWEERWRRAPVAAAIAAGGLAVVVELAAAAVPGPAPDLVLFVGRLHPLAVHLPIGLLAAIGAAEALSLVPRFRDRVDAALSLALPLLLAATVAAFVLGHLLALDRGYPEQTLAWHRRAMLVLVVGAGLGLVAFARDARLRTASSRGVYRGVLGANLLVLSVGAHFGGSLTHGDEYLFRYAPEPLRAWLTEPPPAPAASASAAPPREPLVFADGVLPVFNEHCTECHGAQQSKGGLRLDSLAAILEGGENGPVLVPGEPTQSDLLIRMKLPRDDERRMPPGKRPALDTATIELVEFWIARGASPELRVRDALPSDAVRARLTAITARTAEQGPPNGGPPGGAPPGSAPQIPTPNAASAASASAGPTSTTAASGTSLAPLAILAEKCGKCHGAARQKGRLRLDSQEAVLAGGGDGPVVTPGDPGKSSLFTRISLAPTDDAHMPPADEPQLTRAEVAALHAWIRRLDRGAAPAPVARAAPVTAALDAAPASEPPAGEATEAPPGDAVAGTLRLYPDAVEPILLARCGKCHRGAEAKAGVRVDELAALLAPGKWATLVVPRSLDESLLWSRVDSPVDDDDHMPPANEPQLTTGELELLRRWIELGAAHDTAVELASLSPEARAAVADVPAAAALTDDSREEAVVAEHARVKPRRSGACSVVAVWNWRSNPELAGVAFGAVALVAAASARRRRPNRSVVP